MRSKIRTRLLLFYELVSLGCVWHILIRFVKILAFDIIIQIICCFFYLAVFEWGVDTDVLYSFDKAEFFIIPLYQCFVELEAPGGVIAFGKEYIK